MTDHTNRERTRQHDSMVVTRKRFLVGGAGLALTAGIVGGPRRHGGNALAKQTDGTAEPDSTFFSTAFVAYHDTVDTASDGDLWPSCWADDGNLYTANGDGKGFSDGLFADIVMNRVAVTPETGLSGERLAAGSAIATVWADPALYNLKPTGMVAVDGDGDGKDELYVAVQDLRMGPGAFDDAPKRQRLEIHPLRYVLGNDR